MEHHKLGKTDIYASKICIGCWAYGGGSQWGKQNQNDVDEVVAEALDTGINFFDTAEAYNNGKSEISLGTALRGKRNRAVISTKISAGNVTSAGMEKSLNGSLKRLGTDYIDLYLIHFPLDTSTVDHPILTYEEALFKMGKMQRQGKIRYYGVSNFGVEQMEKVRKTGSKIYTNQLAYSIFSRAIESKIMPMCKENGTAVMAYSILNQGLLTGKFKNRGDVPPYRARTRHFDSKDNALARHNERGAEDEIFMAIDELHVLSESLGVPMPVMAAAWVLEKSGETAVVGVRNVDQLHSMMVAGQTRLGSEIINKIDEISRPVYEKLGDNADYWLSGEDRRTK